MRRRVIIKFFREVGDREGLLQLSKQAALLSQLCHPNNLQVVATQGRVEGPEGATSGPFLVFEHVPGTTLRLELRARRRLSPLGAWRLGLQALGALTECHAIGLVHGDLKPENLMLWQPVGLQDHLKVIDHGLLGVSPRMMAAGSVGTPQYMAPEVARGHAPTPASDLYSLGVVLYEALAGRRPFEGHDPQRIMQQQLVEPPQALCELAPVPEGLAEVVHRSLSKDPAERFPDATSFMSALQRLAWRELSAYQTAAFSPLAVEESIRTDVFAPQALDAAAGTHGEEVHVLHEGTPVPMARPDVTDTTLRTAARPMVWVLQDDPATQQSDVAAAIIALRGRIDIEVLDRDGRERRLLDLVSGRATAPWVLMFGDLHVLIQDPLTAELRCHADTSRLLISTHLHADLLHTTVNFAGLDQHVVLPASSEAIVEAIERMVQRTHRIRLAQDQLRVALRDAEDDLGRVWRAAHDRSAPTHGPRREARG